MESTGVPAVTSVRDRSGTQHVTALTGRILSFAASIRTCLSWHRVLEEADTVPFETYCYSHRLGLQAKTLC